MKTLEEILEYNYPFLLCNEGCWKTGDDEIVAICTMEESHIKHCIDFVKNWGEPDEGDPYKDKITQMMRKKIEELEKAL